MTPYPLSGLEWHQKSPLTLPHLQSTTTLDSCHSKDHHILVPPNTHPTINSWVENASPCHNIPIFLYQKFTKQSFIVSFPISSWSFLPKSPKNKCHLEPSASKQCLSSQTLFLTCFLQILSVTPLNPLLTAAVNAKLIYEQLNLPFGSKSSKASWIILREVIVH